MRLKTEKWESRFPEGVIFDVVGYSGYKSAKDYPDELRKIHHRRFGWKLRGMSVFLTNNLTDSPGRTDFLLYRNRWSEE